MHTTQLFNKAARALRHMGVAGVVLALTCMGCQADTAATEAPGFILFDAQGIAQVKEKLAAGDPYLEGVLAEAVAKADEYLEVKPVSVTDKPMTPPSGDKHDYMSFSPYWWPNPDTPDGMPYVKRDGEYNKVERVKYDVPKLSTVAGAVRALSLAYYFTGDERYAEHAVKHLRHFYINPETRMNPNLQFGQFVPGSFENGRKSGIIESIRMRFMPDSIAMLHGSSHFTDEDYQAMKQWFGDYVTWLTTSEHGVAESKSENNHGTWHAQQVVLYSLFAGNKDTALAAIETIPARIAEQYEADGSQPLENARTRSLHYCDFNNRAMMDIARLAEPLGFDIWNYEATGGKSLRKGYAYMVPFMTGEQEWPHTQIDEPKHKWFAQSLRFAAIGFDEPPYEADIDKLPGRFGENSWIELVVPAK